jgi:hypothetical protein
MLPLIDILDLFGGPEPGESLVAQRCDECSGRKIVEGYRTFSQDNTALFSTRKNHKQA